MNWLAQAASGSTVAGVPKPAKPKHSPPEVPAAAGDVGGGKGGLSWLSAATQSGGEQARSKPRRTSTVKPNGATPAAAPGGWMTSGKLGVSTEDDGDENNDPNGSKGGGAGGAAVGRKKASRASKKKGKVSVPAASGPGGWLAAGSLGVPVDEESDEQEEGGGNGGRAVMVTAETQTEEDIEGIVKRGDAPKLPPWAKVWVPPVPEVVKAVEAEDGKAAGDEKDVSHTTDTSVSEFCSRHRVIVYQFTIFKVR